MEASILQTKQWQDFQIALGEKTFFEKTSDYQYLAILKKTPVGKYLYLPYGPHAKDVASFKESLKSLTKLATENNAFFIRIEPKNPDFIKHFPKKTKKTKDLNPAHNLIIKVPQTPSEVLSQVPKRTRGYYNTYKNKGLSITISDNPEDIKHLVRLQSTLAKSKKIGVFSEDYLKKQLSQPFAHLYLVKYKPEDSKEKVIAAVLVFDTKTTRHYIQAAQDKEYTKLAAPSIVVCQMLIDCIDKGIKYFDFWGIAPENAPSNHPWLGFTRFKKSFGGDEIQYAGTYDIVLKPAKYKLYQFIRRIHLLLRHI